MKFLSSEGRKRTAYIEQAQAEVVDTLRSPVMRAELGATALRLAHIAECLYIPNIRNGVVIAPKTHKDTNHTPIIALSQSEEVGIDPNLVSMSPRQQQNLASLAEKWTAIKDEVFGEWPLVFAVDNILQGSKDSAAISNEEGGLGAVRYSLAGGPLENTRYSYLVGNNGKCFAGRPIIVLTLPQSRLGREARPTVLVHELQHVDQITSDPTLPLNQEKYIEYGRRRELEAYHIGAKYGEVLFFSDDSQYKAKLGVRHNRSVDEIRKMYAREEDPFYPDPRTMRELMKAGWVLGVKPHNIE